MFLKDVYRKYRTESESVEWRKVFPATLYFSHKLKLNEICKGKCVINIENVMLLLVREWNDSCYVRRENNWKTVKKNALFPFIFLKLNYGEIVNGLNKEWFSKEIVQKCNFAENEVFWKCVLYILFRKYIISFSVECLSYFGSSFISQPS